MKLKYIERWTQKKENPQGGWYKATLLQWEGKFNPVMKSLKASLL